MSAKIPDIPSVEDVPDGPLGWLKNWLSTVRLWAQLRDPRATEVGDPLDKFTDRRELVGMGIIRRRIDGSFVAGTGFGGGTTVVVGGGGTGGGGGTTPDLTPPPAPTGLAIAAGIFTINLSWDAPTYTQGHGNALTIIYGAVWAPGDSEPTFSDVRTKRIDTAIEAASLLSYATQPATRWAIWASFQTRDGVEGPPAGGTHGVQDTTGQDVGALLQILSQSIRESELHRTLAEPIRSIVRRADDAAEDALAAALATHQAAQRAAAALLVEAQDRGTSITETRAIVASGDAQLASQITTLTAVVGQNAAAIQTEATTRANNDGAEATARQALATKMTGLADPSGATLGGITSGLLYDERTARSGADGALASRAEALEASVDTPSTGLLARATSLETVTTHATSGNTALATRTGLLESSVNTAGTGLLARATALETVTTAAGSGNSALASRASLLEASVDTAGTGLLARAAALETVTTAAGSGNAALASRASGLEARVDSPSATPGPNYNPTYAALAVESSARATYEGYASTLYTVRTTVTAGGRTLSGGFGLAGTSGGTAGPNIDFGVLANKFYVGAPNDGSAPGVGDIIPFTILTTDTTESGVLIPKGVYIDAAYIRNLTAMYARMSVLIADSITAASIQVSQLVAGSIAVGAYIQSTGYTGSGTNEWRIDGDGVARFSGVHVSGTVDAFAGQIGGNTIDSTGVQSPGYSPGSGGWRLDSSGIVRAFASGGTRVLDMAATGAAPVLKVGTAFHVLADGSAYFGGALAVGTVSANGSTTSGVSVPSLPNSSATYNTGSISFSPAATITGTGGHISAWVSCDIRVAAESAAVDAIRVFAYLYRNGVQVDSSEIFQRACVFPDPTGATRTVAAEVTLLSPLEPLSGAQTFTLSFSVEFRNNSGATVSPGPTAFISYLQAVSRCNFQEIKV